MTETLANSAAFWVVLILVLCAVYLLPTIIGTARRVDRLALVFLVNLIGGTTGVGWLAALILAFGPRRLPPVQPEYWSPPDGPPRLLGTPRARGGSWPHRDARRFKRT
jgi:Superinfection immunity protein